MKTGTKFRTIKVIGEEHADIEDMALLRKAFAGEAFAIPSGWSYPDLRIKVNAGDPHSESTGHSKSPTYTIQRAFRSEKPLDIILVAPMENDGQGAPGYHVNLLDAMGFGTYARTANHIAMVLSSRSLPDNTGYYWANVSVMKPTAEYYGGKLRKEGVESIESQVTL